MKTTMMWRNLGVLAVGMMMSAAAGATAAQAADVAVPVSDLWSGFYVGGQAGYLQGSGDQDLCLSGGGETMCASSGGYDLGTLDLDGVTAGGYAGFNFRMDSVLLGVEGDFNWDNADSGANGFLGEFSYQSSLDWDASIRARLGFVVDDRALLYVTGGPSWIRQEADFPLCSEIGPGVNCGDEQTRFGWQLGGGIEYFVTDSLSVKAEYIHGWYGDEDLNLASESGEGSIFLNHDLQTDVVRVGAAFHFGGL